MPFNTRSQKRLRSHQIVKGVQLLGERNLIHIGRPSIAQQVKEADTLASIQQLIGESATAASIALPIW